MARPLAATVIAAAAVAAAGTGVVFGGMSDPDDGATTAAGGGPCDRFAAPGGADRAPGSLERPFRTPQRLAEALRPGETGCLRRGTYRGRVTISTAGTARRPIVLQPRPGESARIRGLIVVTRRSHHFTLRRLYLDGRNRDELPSPTVNGRNIRFADNDVTNQNTAICFALGHQRFGTARRVTIQRNRIHDCGTLPPTNLEQGVYVAIARDTRVIGNWIYANADQGVQLYPDARRTYIAGNVIDGNGEGIIFGGSPWTAASDNLVVGNVISNSRLRENVESHFDGPIGTGNVVRGNCIGGGVRDAGMGGILSPAVGFEAEGNLLAAPAFRDAASADYRLAPGSPCVRLFRGSPRGVPGPGLAPPTSG
jgi:hypothetical protein